jgi:predicted short-subunit dehydrogenase-like oxidoreductase (DUF2520 family)
MGFLLEFLGHFSNIAEIAPEAPSSMPPCYAAAVPRKPRVAIVGVGSLGSALALLLCDAGFQVDELIVKDASSSRRRVLDLARKLGAQVGLMSRPSLRADLIWLTVPDRQIRASARTLARTTSWEGKAVFHSSGALASDELAALRRRGAVVASVHPLMTFVARSVPSLSGVPFAVEGDPSAVRMARMVVRALGGSVFLLAKHHKAAYHAWGAFASPLLIAELATAETVAQAAGLSRKRARKMMFPIVRQTVANYGKLGPAAAFSGPLVRGDSATLSKHLRILRNWPGPRDVYLALARLAVKTLPTRNRKMLERVLR